MIKKLKVVLLLLFITTNSFAGFYETTVHSRANCLGFNESITWNGAQNHWWKVESIHFHQHGDGPDTHKKTAFMAYTWRAAAYDFGSDPAGSHADQYWVQGYHYYMDDWGRVIYSNYTEAGNCAIYNGWWDRK